MTAKEKNFKLEVSRFLKSVKSRDLKSFSRFFNSKLDFFAILPDGKTYTSTSTFLKSQEHWFSEENGHFEYKIKHTHSSNNLGTARVLVNYEALNSKKEKVQLKIYILLIFINENGAWFLVHDQNSVI